MLSDNNTNADAASDCESPLSGNIVVFVSSLVWTFCYGFQLSRSLATDEVPSIMEFTRRKPVVGVISSRICDSSRITALKQGSMWAIGDGVFCPNSGLRLPCLCRLLMVSALMTTLSASAYFNFAAALVCCMIPLGSRGWWCAWRASLYCFAASAIASRICCFRLRLCAIALPFGRPKTMTDGDSDTPVTVVSAPASWLIIVSYQQCIFITSRRIILKRKGGITSITSKTIWFSTK